MCSKFKGQHHCLVVSFFRTEVHFALYKSNKDIIITQVLDYLVNLQASDIFFFGIQIVLHFNFHFDLNLRYVKHQVPSV